MTTAKSRSAIVVREHVPLAGERIVRVTYCALRVVFSKLSPARRASGLTFVAKSVAYHDLRIKGGYLVGDSLFQEAFIKLLERLHGQFRPSPP